MKPPTIANPAFPTSTSIIRAFEAMASADPGRLAVICSDARITFGELSARSTSLAAILRGSGIGPGDFVGAALPRSVDLMVALLGIMKSGAAYIPIDPSYPAERITHMVGSSRLKRIVTDTANAPKFPMVETVVVADIGNQGMESGTPDHDDENFIYAIFTSGSTGLAKAATVRHRGFQNLLAWYVAELGLTSDDTTLVISSPSFDLTQKNFFAPLVTGGTLVLDTGDNYDIHRITSLVRTHRVTLVNCTPSAFYPLADAAASGGYGDLSTLRFAVLGGEPISIPRLRDWLSHPNCRAEVVNSYGPTECTDICAFHRMNRENIDRFPFVPTGLEIPNVTVTIRDENLAVLPAGETGELCIEGIGVGGGYLNDPSRTEEKFVGGIYRTGDLAKRDEAGVIEFRGRADHQVKVNGFRIELGEIEAALSKHDGVREAVVIAEDGRLIAHVQGDAGVPDLRSHLAASLPSYMIPSEFRPVDRFVLTPNGKIDRKALATPATASSADVPVIASDGMEAKLLVLWSEILGKPVNDPSANFFDLGGTSIHLAIVHVRLREMTGRDLPITDLFAFPSARSLSAHLAPPEPSATAARSQDRARMQQAGFQGFRRPAPRR